MVVLKNKNQDKYNIPVILTAVFCFLILILTFVYYADKGSEQITIFSQLKDYTNAIAEFITKKIL